MKFISKAFVLRLRRLTVKFLRISFAILSISLGSILAQSNSQDFPTPISSTEISAKIPARDIGDPRITTHFYVFEAGQGDVFINVVAGNFSGDIDIFQAGTMKPLAKLKIFAESSEFESGRVIYLQKKDRMILRVNGKSPNDEPSTYRFKFAGSFLSMAAEKIEESPQVTASAIAQKSEARVNSVGTIISTPSDQIFKPVETKTPGASESAKAEPEQNNPKKIANSTQTTAKKVEKSTQKEKEVKPEESVSTAQPKPQKRPKQNQTSDVPIVRFPWEKKPQENKSQKPANMKPAKESQNPETIANPEKAPKTPTTETVETADRPESKEDSKAKAPTTKQEESNATVADPLAGVSLVVLLKNGRKIEYSLGDVLRFGIDQGILTITGKEGKVESYPMLEVQKVTVE
jgi:hypothetical protein